MFKTCAICAQCLPVIGHCDEHNDTVDLNEEACRDYKERDVTKAYTADGKEILTFAGVKLLEAYDRTVKYEQLEHVAKHLYEVIKRDADSSWSPAKEEIAKNCKEKLEALGVIIDD